jgi:two-component system response regulator AtoC
MSGSDTQWLLVTDSIAIAGQMQSALEAIGQAVELVAPDAVEDTGAAGLLVDVACTEAVVSQWAQKLPIVVLAPEAEEESAIAALRAGARDYLRLPPDEAALEWALERARRSSQAEGEPPRATLEEGGIVGSGIAMKKLMSKLKRAARSTSTVLVHGESGTGKELVARQLHRSSPRAEGPYVKVHCGALPDNLLESELFGYEKGAFTGAEARKPGRFELAEGGTLFLDEIGEISPAVQVKLLRVLQEREYERLGGVETLTADVRFVAATHRDLKALVKEGKFREDLYYRLNVVRLEVPPLRARPEDIPALVARFAKTSAESNGLAEPKISSDAVRRLQGYSWPGNVRQLQHIIERLVVMASSPELSEDEVAAELKAEGAPAGTIRGVTVQRSADLTVQELADALRIAERRALEKALKKAGKDRSLAARLLGISRRKLFYMLKDHELG